MDELAIEESIQSPIEHRRRSWSFNRGQPITIKATSHERFPPDMYPRVIFGPASPRHLPETRLTMPDAVRPTNGRFHYRRGTLAVPPASFVGGYISQVGLH